jgi:indole-3-glycerol phosphate synthase
MLDQILVHKRTEIERLDLPTLKSMALDAARPRDFVAGLNPLPNPSPIGKTTDGGGTQGRGRGVRLIAELKRASPSRGMLAPNIDLIELARIYTDNGAAALSVLTDEKFFMGSLETLRALRFTHHVSLPMLRKDFTLAPVQVYETRAAGADAILLIAAALPDDSEIADLHALALELGLTPLVEVHNREELERILPLPQLKLVGINNRDLKTFTISLDTTAALRPHIPREICVVSESGIFTAAHVEQLAALDVNAILVGEALVTAPDIGAKVRELSGLRIADF